MERKKIFDILDIIALVLIIPVLILGIFCSVLMYNAKHSNGVPSMFGYSAVTISQDIATDEHPDFTEDAKVLVTSVSPENIQIGDYIAFYSYVPEAPEGEEQEISEVLFRRVVEINEDENPDTQQMEYYFVTGDAEGVIDQYEDTDGTMHTAYISQDYVIGRYYQSAGFATNFFTFCASTTGIVTVVVVPAAVVLIIAGISLTEQIIRSKKEKDQNRKKLIEAEKLLQGEAPTTAGNMNLNSNVPPKAPVGQANTAGNQTATTAPKPTTTATPAKPATTTTPAKPTTASSQTKATTTASQVKPATPPKAPAKPAAPPKALEKPATPPKPSTPPPKPTDKK